MGLSLGVLNFRWFRSKGATLVLIWLLLTIAGNRMLFKVLDAEERKTFLILGTGISVVIAAPFFGWLAGAKLGNYKVVKIGIIVSWVASVLLSLFTLLYYNTSLSSHQNVAVRKVLFVAISIFQWTGSVIIAINSLQLSLEQMPDASAENITSLISWFVFTLAAGYWVGGTVKDLVLACVPYNQSDLYQVLSLFPKVRLGPCKAKGLYLFTLHPVWCAMLMTLVYESLVYPCFKHRLPSSMKRMGMASFAVVLRNIMFLIVNILVHFNVVEREAPWMLGINSVLFGVLMAFSTTACF